MIAANTAAVVLGTIIGIVLLVVLLIVKFHLNTLFWSAFGGSKQDRKTRREVQAWQRERDRKRGL